MTTLHERSLGAGPEGHFLSFCRVGWDEEGCCILTPQGSLDPRQELWAGSQKPWVLILVLQCSCVST